MEKLSGVRLKVMDELKRIAGRDKKVRLHTKYVERYLVEDGTGSCSVSRYLRLLREEGYITYDNPKRRNHFYEIKLLKKR